MQIVTDSGVNLSSEQWTALGVPVQVVPLRITLDGKTYQDGIDVTPDNFYDILDATDSLPVTSLPSPGEFAAIYRQLAAEDPDIFSIHMSSGLSGTFNAACEGAKMVAHANVTLHNTMTLSGAAGWQLEAAARTIRAGWPVDRILALLNRISDATDTLYTLEDLKYLIHGGRISHIKGLLASILNIKPVIGVDHEHGKYYERGKARTVKRAIDTLVDSIARQHGEGSRLRVQIMHAANPQGAALLREKIAGRFDCTWVPTDRVSVVLTAHTGWSLVGAAYAPQEIFDDLPA